MNLVFVYSPSTCLCKPVLSSLCGRHKKFLRKISRIWSPVPKVFGETGTELMLWGLRRAFCGKVTTSMQNSLSSKLTAFVFSFVVFALRFWPLEGDVRGGLSLISFITEQCRCAKFIFICLSSILLLQCCLSYRFAGLPLSAGSFSFKQNRKRMVRSNTWCPYI